MIFVCPHSSRERERETKREASHVFCSTQIFFFFPLFFFFCHFFLVVVAEKKKEKKRKKIVGSIRNDRSASLPEEQALFPQKSRIDGTFFWSFLVLSKRPF